MTIWHRIKIVGYMGPYRFIDNGNHLPAAGKPVAVMVPGRLSPFCGWCRYAAGDPESPMFVVYHGNSKISARPYAWCDCIPQDFPAEKEGEIINSCRVDFPERSQFNIYNFVKYAYGGENSSPLFDYDNIMAWYKFRFGINPDPKSYDLGAIEEWYQDTYGCPSDFEFSETDPEKRG